MPNNATAIQQTLDAIESAEQIENEVVRVGAVSELRRRLEYLRNELGVEVGAT